MHPWVRLGPLELPAYYVAIALGLTAATFVLAREARREGLPRRAVFDTALLVVPASAIGARLFAVASAPEVVLAQPWHLVGPQGGWVFHGALIVATVVVAGFAAWRGLDPWRLVDCYAPAVAFGHAFARLGCLAAGCCHGRPADWPLGVAVPWAVIYPHPGHLPAPLLGVPLHPAPLYESWMLLALFVGLTAVRRAQRYPGQALVVYLGGYGVGRFVVEWFRGDRIRGFPLDGPLSTGQVTSLILLAVAVGIHLWRRRTCTPS